MPTLLAGIVTGSPHQSRNPKSRQTDLAVIDLLSFNSTTTKNNPTAASGKVAPKLGAAFARVQQFGPGAECFRSLFTVVVRFFVFSVLGTC